MKFAPMLRPVATHSIAGLILVLTFAEYAIVHPEAFTPGVFTDCACGLLAALTASSGVHAYASHKFTAHHPTPEQQPDLLAKNGAT